MTQFPPSRAARGAVARLRDMWGEASPRVVESRVYYGVSICLLPELEARTGRVDGSNHQPALFRS